MATVAQGLRALALLDGASLNMLEAFNRHVKRAWKEVQQKWVGNERRSIRGAIRELDHLERLERARDRLQARIDKTRLGAV